MKVTTRSDRIPMVLIAFGSIMVVASSFDFTIRNASFLFIAGWSMTLFGFVLWAVPAINSYIRRRQRSRVRMERSSRDGHPAIRSRAPPRR
ncbi:MAG: hypothetical protein MUC62_08100 [Candidatus Thermoplasmatota archaeon]|jgi:hypothetical protein|nr:hypothetical protein [Candidatus Thermoplasmatota archaeon]